MVAVRGRGEGEECVEGAAEEGSAEGLAGVLEEDSEEDLEEAKEKTSERAGLRTPKRRGSAQAVPPAAAVDGDAEHNQVAADDADGDIEDFGPTEVEEMVDDEEDASDPFEAHFANPDENELSKKLNTIAANGWDTQKTQLEHLGTVSISFPQGTLPKSTTKRSLRSPRQLKLKKRLVEPAQKVISEFTDLEGAVAPIIFEYQDLLFGARSVSNVGNLRRLMCLHALNHIFKTRDRIIKNNARLARDQDKDNFELRDQGFTRPKVLMLLETRQSCVRAVDTIMSLCEPEQQENKKRFQDYYVQTEDKFSEDRPADFRELFEGNDDNEFRLGMKFTRKTVKYFSQFYNSDIIFASPLGLRRAIESGDPKKQDSDFLSSIEVVIVDQADAMLMQNWEHVEFVFEHLNLQPKDPHGCDFSRVRSWYLDGNAKYLRQTLVFSAYLTPELNKLYSRHMQNVAGKLKYQPSYDGAMLDIGLQLRQTFSRYDSPAPASDPDARFKYFTTAVIPSLSRYPKPADGGQGILIFIPSYLDFVRIRNYFATSTATQNISFGAISEVIMYGLPENPIFYQELVGGYLGATIGEGKIDPSEAVVRVLFSKWDGLRLERVVGTKRVAAMLREKSGDTFDFV
ncbi:rRNA-binding ribosome biosynthesis protein utp25 [Coniosporium tulheliwenetii]|uniref:rRNA-binding ribosome biosynthesis protein utp25 n=1 Tax=Coniosporium tulheliwenetii TaxID=3383036 RepID=A0ACC2Z4D7_9PEZI|nr:rRNA-binding ribosome biosynthesis protein utp25 [Cladosporium sp. JES 115]